MEASRRSHRGRTMLAALAIALMGLGIATPAYAADGSGQIRYTSTLDARGQTAAAAFAALTSPKPKAAGYNWQPYSQRSIGCAKHGWSGCKRST